MIEHERFTYSRQSRTSDVMHDELLFTHDDDPFLYDSVRAQLDVDAAIGEGKGLASSVYLSHTPDWTTSV